MKIHIRTYGCTLNQADSDIMHALLSERHEVVDDEEQSDVTVLNTCTVKGATENKIFELMKRLQERDRRFVVAGCLSANMEKVRRYAPHAPVVGTSSLRSICDAVEDAAEGKPTVYKGFEPKDGLPKAVTAPIMRIPINDGCVSSCSFCQTKLARPFLRSYSPKTVVKWLDESVRKEAREIQLTSMDSGAYGLDIKTGLVRLLDTIAGHGCSGRFLVRLGMINPEHAKRMLQDIIRIMEHDRFYRFLHVPVQTGSEKVCREMGRKHTVRDFRDIVEAVRAEIPDATIATDIIVGYPTETEDDFRQTLDLLRDTEPDIVNVSKFSARPGTRAKELRQLHNDEIKRRSKEASMLVRRICEKRKKAYIGQRCEVLVTEESPDPKGRDINYHQVVVKGFRGRLGDFVDVEIIDANHGSLFGEAR
jgi:MiaB-like tRNA modifying enzyme